jgi:hypothetical protein
VLFAVKSIKLSLWSTVAEDKQLRDGERMNSENTLLSLRAPSADEGAEDGGVSGRHSRFRDASFTTELPCILLKRQDSVEGERSVNPAQGE